MVEVEGSQHGHSSLGREGVGAPSGCLRSDKRLAKDRKHHTPIVDRYSVLRRR